METEERTEERMESESASSRKVVPVKDAGPPVPKGMTDEEMRDLKERALNVVRRLERATGSEELDLVASVANVGIQAQTSAGTELELLRVQVSDALSREGPGAQISKHLVDLRIALNRINPHDRSHQGFVRRVFGALPFFGNPCRPPGS